MSEMISVSANIPVSGHYPQMENVTCSITNSYISRLVLKETVSSQLYCSHGRLFHINGEMALHVLTEIMEVTHAYYFFRYLDEMPFMFNNILLTLGLKILIKYIFICSYIFPFCLRLQSDLLRLNKEHYHQPVNLQYVAHYNNNLLCS